ncbi:MAG: tetratricopeptide repeat protein [bacterium]
MGRLFLWVRCVSFRSWIPLIVLLILVLASLCFPQTVELEKARELVVSGSYSEAEALISEILKTHRDNAEANYLMARIMLSKQSNDEAIDFARRAVKIDGSQAEYQFWLARAHLAKAMESGVINSFRYARKAKESYEKAVDLDPKNVEARFELFMYLVMAPRLVGGDIKKAEEHAITIEKLSDLYGNYARAALSEKNGDIQTAEKHYLRASEIDTSSAFFAHLALGLFYERQKRIDDALRVFRNILEVKPDMSAALFHIGRILVTNKMDLDEAEYCFKKYIEIEPPKSAPNWAAAHWRLGMVYELKGRVDEALEEYRKAVEAAPGVDEYKRSLKELERKAKK